MTTQPEAIRLADALDGRGGPLLPIKQAAAELRRLHAENEALKTVPMKYRRMKFNAELQDENKALLEALTLIAGAENSALDLARCKGIARAAIDTARSKT